MAAFLWSINQLLTNGGTSQSGKRILYISPLKALNSDIEMNLREPLKQLKQVMGDQFREIRIAVRSGDTGCSERRKQEKEKADIYITTPESLAILMSRKSWPELLTGIGTVIVDEIHSLVGNKRGVLLLTLLELLETFNGPFQRLALSATVKPLEKVAHWFAGRELNSRNGQYTLRQIDIVNILGEKRYEIVLDRPEPKGKAQFAAIGPWLLEQIRPYKGVLVFANSRRQVERSARIINDANDSETIVAVHHGSLAKEIRKEVETEFKAGRLKGVVATHSLELGVDIGSVEQVILLGTPFSVASTLQRIGRSGHQVDAASKGLLVPRHRLDHIYGLIMAELAIKGRIETASIIEKPIDVLAQLILIFIAAGLGQAEQLIEVLWRSDTFRTLSREELHQTLELLAGRIDGKRHNALIARIHYDAQAGACLLRPHARLLLFRAAGVIADRGYFSLRQADNNLKIGELDEEFVWERNLGDLFPFANRIWRITHKDHVNVWVMPHQGDGGIVPFWRAEPNDRDPSFCDATLNYFEFFEDHKNPLISDSPFLNCSRLVEKEILHLLKEQQQSWGCLPAHNRIILESKRSLTDAGERELMLFTFRGGRFNRTLALVLEWKYQKKTGKSLNPLTNNEGIIFRVENPVSVVTDLLQDLDATDLHLALHDLLPSRTHSVSLFRELAQISLLIPRSWPGQRGPLWWRRERSARLMEDLSTGGKCILLDSCWRETLSRHYETDSLKKWIDDFQENRIEQRIVNPAKPSPMAADLIWQHENELMYKAETAVISGKPSMEILRQINADFFDNPMSEEVSQHYFLEKWRLVRGMEPDTPQELSLWLTERTFIPLFIWQKMAELVCRKNKKEWEDFCQKGKPFYSKNGSLLGYVDSHLTLALLAKDPSKVANPALLHFFCNWLRFFPSLTVEQLSQYWDWPEQSVQDLLALFSEEMIYFWPKAQKFSLHTVVKQIWQRARSLKRKGLFAVDAPGFYRFLSTWQRRTDNHQSTKDRLEELLFRFLLFPLPASVWFTSFFPDLCPGWDREKLQTLMNRHGFLIRGDVSERIGFILPQDLFDLASATPLSLEPIEMEIALLIEKNIGEVSSSDLLQLDLSVSHHQVLMILKKLFLSGRIVGSQLDGVEALLGVDYSPASTTRHVSLHRHRRFRTSPMTTIGRVSRGWRWAGVVSKSPVGLLERREEVKEWIRLLLERHGLFFPELLGHEWPIVSWPELRSVLSQMEWAGELISGHFVRGSRYPQYLAPYASTFFCQKHTTDWQVIHSAGPSSLCGYKNGLFRYSYPFPRQFGWLVCENGHWMLAVSQNGKKLHINSRGSSEHLLMALEKIRDWIRQGHRFGERSQWIINHIEYNGGEESVIHELLEKAGFCREMTEWVLKK